MKVELTFSIKIEQTFFVKLSSLGILYIYIYILISSRFST